MFNFCYMGGGFAGFLGIKSATKRKNRTFEPEN